jgi:flagellar hook assembly protein FlgD
MQITGGLLAVWDTTKVADGSYDLRLIINDESGATDSVTLYNIVVQNGLDIYNFTALPNPFAVSTNISYTLENPADVTVEVLDAVSLTLVKTLVDNETQVAGTHTTIWDGEGATADIGDYICKISAPGAKAPEPITIRRIANNSNIRARIDFPDTGVIAGTIAIMGEAGNSIDSDFASYSVDFSVDGSSIWTPIFSNARPIQPSGILVSNWDTRELVNGDYVLRLTVSDTAGNSKAVTKEITVANEVTLAAVPSVITPNAPDGIKTTTITYSLPKPVSSANLGIYLGSTLVKTFTTFTAQGTYSLTWDATEDNFSPVPGGQYNCVLIADEETKTVAITVDRGTSVVGAEIKLDNSQPVFGKPYFDWAACGSGQYDIAQRFDWKVTASGTERWIARVTKSGSKGASDGGEKESGNWTFVIVGMEDQPLASGTYFATQRRWVVANIDYGIIFANIPEPDVSLPTHFVNSRGFLPIGSGFEVYGKTRSGCKARVWVYYNIYNIVGEHVANWIYAPSDHVFSWSVSGDIIRSASVSNSTALLSGTAYAHLPHQATYSVTVNPQHGGTVDHATGNAWVSYNSNPDVHISITKNSQPSGRSIIVSGDLTGTVPQEPQFEGNWSVGDEANPLFKRDNLVSYNTPLTFGIFSSLSYTPPFELDKAPHCSQWTVFGPHYPDNTITNPDITFTDSYGEPAASPLYIGDGSTFVIGDSGTENKGQDEFIAKLKIPYEGRTFIKIPGIANTGNFERYRIEFGASSVPEVWQTIKESTIPIPEGTLGYWDVTRLNGEYTLLLTVYDAGGIPACAHQKTFQIGQPITPSGGQVQDAYGTVTIDFPSGSLITDKAVTISPVKAEEIKIFNKDFKPFGPIYEFESYPGNLNEDDFAKDSDGNIIKPATLTFKGTALELGITPEDESKIGIYTFDPLTQEIQLIPCVVTKDAGGLFTISAKIIHFCYYFLAKDTLPPQFTISISPDPVSDGNVSIKVKSSKTLEGPPSVKVVTPDGQTHSLDMVRDSSVEAVNTYIGTFLLTAEEMHGTADVNVSGKDLAGNQGSAIARFTIDTSLPVFSVVAIPDPAGVGEVTLRICFTRRLARPPTVTVMPFGRERQIVNVSGNDCRYTGIFSVKQGMDGTALVEIVGETETGKDVSGSGTFEIVTTRPELSVSVTPEIANGEVNITVTSSRRLAGLPKVMAKPYGQAAQPVEMSVISESDHIYKGKFIVVPGSTANGEALVTISALDEAGNLGETSTTFIVDTIPPELTVSVSPRLISSGEVSMTIVASEALDQSPNVTVTQKGSSPVPVNVVKEGELAYSGTYTVDVNFPGIAIINVSAKDLADNTTTATESFVVDTEPPLLTVSAIPNSCSLGEIKIIVSSLKELRNSPEVSVTLHGETQPRIINMARLPFSSTSSHVVEQYRGTFIVDRDNAEGVVTINVSGIDVAGNSSKAVGIFDIDHTPPKFEVSANPALSKAGTVTISVAASEPVRALPMVIVSESSGENSQPLELTASPEFSKVLDAGVVMVDNGRLCLKVFEPGEVVTFPFDDTYKKKPIKIGESLYKISGVNEHFTEKLEVEVNASVVDEKGAPIVDFSSAGIKSGDPWTIYGLANTYTGKYEVIEGRTPEGQKTISVSATDFAGNEGWGSSTFRTDTAPPAFTISISPNPARTGKVSILVTAPKKLKCPPEVKVTPFTQAGQKMEMKDALATGKPIATGNVMAIKSAEIDDFPISYLVLKLYHFDEPITFPLDGSWERKLVKVNDSFYKLAYLAQGFSEEGLVEVGCILADLDGKLLTHLTTSGIEQNDPWAVCDYDYSGIFVVDRFATCNGIARIEVSGIDEAGNKATAFGEFMIAGGYDTPLELISEKVVNYPNPFHAGREDTTIQYYLNKSANVKMHIYDLFGNLVRTLDFSLGEEGGQMGRNRVPWDGHNGRGIVVANGGYICRIEAKAGKERKVRIRKIGVLK